jgi:hypothetical protein
MTHFSCPDCRLRFTPALAAYLPCCPTCGQPMQPLDGADEALGLRLFRPDDGSSLLAHAVAVAIHTDTSRPEPR